MKKWKAGLKRIVAVALAVLLVGNTIEGSSFAVYAAEEGEDTYIATRPTALYVGGIEVDVSEEPTGTISGDTWGYDYGTNTLTVTGDIAIGGSEVWWDLGAIEPRGDLNIKVTEDAVLTGVYGIWNDPGSTNIIVNEGVTLTLNVTGAGISASGDVTLSGGGTLKAIISSTGGYEPILVYGDLKVSNMTINTAGGQCSCLVGSGGNYTIENSQVTFPNGIVHDSDKVNITNSIITEGTTTTVYGEATLRETLTIGSGETINFESGASITNMDSLTIEDGATTQVAGIEHIHNTKGQKNYTDSTTNSYRIGTVACADCPMGYVCDMVEIQEDYTIAEDENLKIPDGGILMLGDGVTLTNNGTLTFGSNSSFNAGEGTYTGKGAVKIGDSDGIIFENELYYYGETLDMSITNPTYFKAGEGYAIFDPSVAILTLNNATITGAGYEGNSYAVYYDGDLIINFSGTNTIAGDNTEGDNSVGILVGGALTLDGTSNSILNVKGGAATSTSMGAKCKDTLTVNGGTVNAIGGTSLSSCGIFSGDIIVNEGATLNAVGGSADAESAGIASSGDISGNVNGIVYSPAGDDGYIYFTVYGNATLGADFTPGDYGSMSEYFSNTTTFFIIPEETSLTVPEGVTLDLTQLDSDNICIQGEVINNGNISCNHYENKLTYTGFGATITVKCSDCGMENSITLTALGGEYKGTAYEASYDEPTGLLEGTAPEIIYADEEGNPLDSAPVDVGTYTVSITVSDQTASVEYTITPAELTVTEAIAKDKVYDGTQEVEITGVTLDGVVSDEDVSVDVSDLSGTVRSKNAGTYTSVVLPELTLIGEDIANYILIQPEVVNSLVTIEPDEAEITVGAETYKKTYGDAAFALDVTDSNPDVDVQYEVTSGADVVSVSDGMVTILKAGTADIKVILPKSENYKAAEVTVTVTVDKAKDAPNMPAATRNVAKNVQRVSDVTLPDGWTWQDADEAVELKAGVETNATAIYTDEDKDSYENVTVIVAITRDVCEHADTEILGKVEATCTVYGYTGDTYCKDCETTIEKGTATEPLGHTYTSKVTKEPTCAESGERTYTCACGDSYTEVIAKVAHSYTSKVTKEPTTKEEGIRTYTCTNCNHSYTESIAKLTETVHEHSYSSTVTKEATCTEAGERTYTCACGNSYTEEIAKLEHIWDSGKVTKEATATEAGEKTYTCQVCGSTKAEAIEATAVLLKKGDKVVDKNSNAIYKVTKAGATGGTVQFVSLINKNVKTVKIPKTITTGGITYKVTSIAKNACKGNKKLIKVTIGSNVKTIGTNAFYGCSKLKTVTMGKNVTTIGNKAFYKCTAITKITIPSKVTKIGKQAFYGCKKLKTITVNSKKLTSKKVGTNAFKGIHKKATIKVPTAKLKAYKSMLKKKGIGAEVKVKKNNFQKYAKSTRFYTNR